MKQYKTDQMLTLTSLWCAFVRVLHHNAPNASAAMLYSMRVTVSALLYKRVVKKEEMKPFIPILSLCLIMLDQR